MAQETYKVLGSDLAMTRYTGVAASVPLDAADSWGSLDVGVVPGGRGGLRQVREPRDLKTVTGRENLAQALILRLLTPRGALSALGHPDYGSRLVELIGELNNETSRNRARLFTIEVLSQEPRVKQLLGLVVEASPDFPDVIRIGFSILPINDTDPLSLTLEITL